MPLSPRATAAPLAFVALLFACDRTKAPEPAPASPAPSASSATAAFDAGSLAVSHPAPARVVAIGDLHGDLEATRKVLRLAGAIDASDAWIGKDLVVVQTGDEIDRGDDDRTILDLFDRLAESAKKAGGDVIALVGNHELMNAAFDFRYVTPGAFTAFTDVPGTPPAAAPGGTIDATQRGRAAAFAPGGPYAMRLAKRPVVARVGDSVFVHGGVLPKHVRYGLDRANEETRAWLEGKGREPSRTVMGEDGLVWTRAYSGAPGREECAALDEALGLLHAKRLVMGHTPQKPGIQPACNDHAWRIDVGLAKFYGGPVQALELRGDAVKVLALP